MSSISNTFPLTKLSDRLTALGANQVLVKHLARNDNGKNQIYLAGDVSGLGLLPAGEVQSKGGTSSKPGAERRGPIFHAAVNLWWLDHDFQVRPAPHAKLIVYPQYSEVRLSGFVKGSPSAPSELFDINKRGREVGRVLVLAPLPDGRVIAAAFDPESEEANALRAVRGDSYGVMQRFDIGSGSTSVSSESLLLSELRRINELGWLAPVYLQADGSMRPCSGPNCGGVTLESHLGIRANGSAEPDFHGWEVKQHAVGSLEKPRASRITLMTPEPSGGIYVDKGPEFFVRKWGYADRLDRPDRINFGGVYRSGGQAHALTRLRLVLDGYDAQSGKFSAEGSVALVDPSDQVAASWHFAKLMDHWRRKHAQAAFVPSVIERVPSVKYRYGNVIGLAEGAKFRLLLRAFSLGLIYYDPGMKIESASTSKPRTKRRSQFRVDSGSLISLYERYRQVNVDNNSLE